MSDTPSPLPANAELPKLLDAYKRLSDTIVQATRERFPKGAVVHWVRRGYRQRGEVVGVFGFQAHGLRLDVLNTSTGKTVALYLYEIEELRNGK